MRVEYRFAVAAEQESSRRASFRSERAPSDRRVVPTKLTGRCGGSSIAPAGEGVQVRRLLLRDAQGLVEEGENFHDASCVVRHDQGDRPAIGGDRGAALETVDVAAVAVHHASATERNLGDTQTVAPPRENAGRLDRLTHLR